MRTLALTLLGVVCACSSGPRLPRAPQGEPVVEVLGAVKHGPHALGSADLERLPQLTVRGTDPRSGRAAAWHGPSIAAMVSDRVELRKGADTVVMRTRDRSAIPVPLTVIRQLKPVLADRADGARVEAPVVAWPSEEQKGLASDPRARSWWAHDVVAFEIVEWQRTFGPALAAPEGALDAARRGGSLFGESCISCHRMRGVGGERGPDLTTVAARLRQAPFAAVLAGHPGWSERREEEAGDAAATELWTFLRAVAVTTPGGSGQLTAGRGRPVADSP